MANPDGNISPGASPRVSLIVPTYREAGNLRALTGRIAEALRGVAGGYEIVIVDDDSRDGTTELVEELAGAGLPVRLIVRRGERDLSSAVLRGFAESRGEVLVCMDADLSHPPEAVPGMLAGLEAPGVDCCVGTRYAEGGSMDKGWPWHRRLNSWAGGRLARIFTPISDPMSGFFALPRHVLERGARLRPLGYKILLEIIVKCGIRNVREVPIHFSNRHAGTSKLGFRQQVRYVRHVGRLLMFSMFCGRGKKRP